MGEGPPAERAATATLAAWVEAEFLPWRRGGADVAAIEQALRDEARRDGQICLFRMEDGAIDFAPFTRIHRPHLLDPAHSGGARAHLYLGHLREAARRFGVRGSALFGVFVADLHLARPRAPVFAYQKPAGNRCLLLPDVDLLGDGGCREEDPIPFARKRPQAIFVGSTTGTPLLTREQVAAGANPRLAAARFFRDRDDVVFHLPNIVQHDGPATRAAIEALGVGGRWWSRAEQQAFRYLLTMDGNGATCSRVATGLWSEQVLVKYASPHQLYYFRGLEPWRHYLPVREHRDVLDLLEDARRDPGSHEEIALRSREFARRFLTRGRVLRYSALMLAAYVARFGRRGPPQ